MVLSGPILPNKKGLVQNDFWGAFESNSKLFGPCNFFLPGTHKSQETIPWIEITQVYWLCPEEEALHKLKLLSRTNFASPTIVV